MTIHRDEDGKLPAYAWPGGYPIYYFCADGGCLCPECANGSEAYTGDYVPEKGRGPIVGQDVYWEGPTMFCDHCGAEIESAYGDPDNPDE